MKTKINILSILFIGILTITSCSRKGCTDENATNYIEEAKKDDGTCVYPTEVEVKRVTANSFPNLDANGNAWDNPGDADPYVKIKISTGEFIFQGQSYINPQSTIDWYINPPLLFTDLKNPQEFTIIMYDEDGSVDDLIGEVTINLSEYTITGTNVSKYPSQISYTDSNFSYLIDVVWK